MSQAESPVPATDQGRSLHERRLGRTIISTYRTTVDLDDVVPNDRQPRRGPKESLELQRQIEANEGLFEPLLLEPHPDLPGKYRIVDGDRRWSNSRVLVEVHKKEQYRKLPAEIIDRTLTDDERIRVWVYIHRQRKEWDRKEKEMVAYSLVDMEGRASAANYLGITVRALDKLVDIYELSEKLTNLREPGSSITWAREVKNLSKKLVTPSVLNTIIEKINNQEITNSKDIRNLRKVLRDPVAKDEFLNRGGTIAAAMEKVSPPQPVPGEGLGSDLAVLVETMRRYPWTTLESMRGDEGVMKSIEDAEKTLQELKKALSK